MAVPKYFEMHKPLLLVLSDGQCHTLREIKSAVAQYFHLSESDLAEVLPSGRQTYFSNRIGWARTYLKKAGLIESTGKGLFRIHARGAERSARKPRCHRYSLPNALRLLQDFCHAVKAR